MSFRTFSFLFVAAIVTCLAIAAPVFSAPPDFAQTPAETIWIVHADFDALHKSTVYRRLAATVLARWQPLTENLAAIDRQLGMDLAKDLHGMTVFGPKLSESKAALVMRADWDPQTFRQKLALAASHDVSASGRYEIHRFSRKDHGQLRTVAGACWRPGTFVFGQTRDDVLSTLDVLDGRRPNLAASQSPLAAEPPPGTVLLARIVAGGEALPFESPVLKETEQIELTCGEYLGECFVRGKLLAKNAQAAEQLKKAIDGFVAMARLNAKPDGDARKLLDRVSVSVDGRAVRLDFHIPAEELAVQLEKLIKTPERAKQGGL